MSTQPHRVQRSVRLRQDDGHSCPRPFLAVLEISASDNPGRLAEIFREAAAAGYKAIVVDSLTNFWSGPGGALEIVGAAGNGNSWSGWKTGKPAQNAPYPNGEGRPAPRHPHFPREGQQRSGGQED